MPSSSKNEELKFISGLCVAIVLMSAACLSGCSSLEAMKTNRNAPGGLISSLIYSSQMRLSGDLEGNYENALLTLWKLKSLNNPASITDFMAYFYPDRYRTYRTTPFADNKATLRAETLKDYRERLKEIPDTPVLRVSLADENFGLYNAKTSVFPFEPFSTNSVILISPPTHLAATGFFDKHGNPKAIWFYHLPEDTPLQNVVTMHLSNPDLIGDIRMSRSNAQYFLDRFGSPYANSREEVLSSRSVTVNARIKIIGVEPMHGGDKTALVGKILEAAAVYKTPLGTGYTMDKWSTSERVQAGR